MRPKFQERSKLKLYGRINPAESRDLRLARASEAPFAKPYLGGAYLHFHEYILYLHTYYNC
jgi:hypothetical protein